MTLFIPDISHHQAGISFDAMKNEGAAAVIARVGQGAGRRTDGGTYGTTRDREWTRHRDEARRVGLPLVAYWYVGNLISAEENARLAAEWVGDKTIPWMIDHEDASGDLARYCATVAAFTRAGLRVILGYVPRWYWASQGSGDLSCGPPLVNSRYTTARGTASQIYAAAEGDTGNGWPSFGGRAVALWQFTNQASMAGKLIDMSAYKGTREQLAQLINGTPKGNDNVKNILLVRTKANPATYAADGVTRRWISTEAKLGELQGAIRAAGGNATVQTVGDVDAFGADLAASVGALANDEENVIAAVRGIVAADSNADVEISAEQLDQLANAVVSAVPATVADAVRAAFARAGQTPTA